MMDYEIKRQIVDVCHMMSGRGLVGTYEGNVSVRDGDRIYLTPSGQSKDLQSEGKIIVTDLEGKVLEGQLQSGDTAHVRLRAGKVVIESEAAPAAEAPAETTKTPAEK